MEPVEGAERVWSCAAVVKKLWRGRCRRKDLIKAASSSSVPNLETSSASSLSGLQRRVPATIPPLPEVGVVPTVILVAEEVQVEVRSHLGQWQLTVKVVTWMGRKERELHPLVACAEKWDILNEHAPTITEISLLIL